MRYIVVLTFVFAFHLSHGQTEFTGKQTGVSLGFLSGMGGYDSFKGGGFDLHIKNGIIASLSISNIPEVSSTAGLAYISPLSSAPFTHRLAVGAFYGEVMNIPLWGMHLSPMFLFFNQSTTPFSITASFLMQKTTNDYNNQHPGLSFTYTQALFKNDKVYPVIGLTRSSTIKLEEGAYFVFAGLYLKLF